MSRTWRAKCWLGSSAGFQELEVKANTLNGARDQLERVYGAEQISNLREVNSWNNSSSSDLGDVGGYVMIGGILFALWLIVEYWWIVVPIAAITLVGWLYTKFSDN